MYLRKASLDQRQIRIIVCTGTSYKYISITDPEIIEWVPIYEASKPRRLIT